MTEPLDLTELRQAIRKLERMGAKTDELRAAMERLKEISGGLND